MQQARGVDTYDTYEPSGEELDEMLAEKARLIRGMRREALKRVVATMTPEQRATASVGDIITAVRAALAGGIDYDVDWDENGNPSNATPYLRVSPGAVFEKSGSAVARLHLDARTVVAVEIISRPRARESAPRVVRSSRRTAASRGSPARRSDDDPHHDVAARCGGAP
jgi:hypothetical protein